MTGFAADVLGVVTLLNRIVVTGILVTAFALIIYIGLYNRTSPIARRFALVLACVIGAFLGDLLTQVAVSNTDFWLRFQWIGIALIPAASLALSDTLLRATGDAQPLRQLAPKLGAALGVIVFSLVWLTPFVATPGLDSKRLPHLAPGPLFPVFTLYFFGSLAWATYNVIEARRRSLTSTSKRRMTYFAIAFAGPSLSVFPYLLPAGWPDALPQLLPWLVVTLVNMAVGAAITFMGYTMAYFGASAPDRVIKRRMVKYLIRGPLLAALVITALVASMRVERWLDLPGFIIGLVAAATIILLAQLFIVTLQPAIDRLIAGEDSGEVKRLQQFSERLMTTSDQTQYLENILAALCDLLRAKTAFVAVDRSTAGEDGAINVVIGHAEEGQGASPAALPVTEDVIRATMRAPVHADAATTTNGHSDPGADPDASSKAPGPVKLDVLNGGFLQWEDFWLVPLRASNGADVLGVMGLAARASRLELTDEERQGVTVLIERAARAIEDALKQRRAFEALERLVPDAEEMQRRMAQTANPAAPTVSDFERLTTERYDDMTRYVQDAFKDFWGGPKFTDSPLMELQVVANAMKAENGNASKALRRVLFDAIERLKPDGQRSFTAAEWMLYNILELKVLQSQKVRDVARKLVMSESDLFRKQKAAFAEVARVVVEMEREAQEAPGADAAPAQIDTGAN
jgi:hypothetical protein